MDTTATFFTEDHRRCDATWAELEASVERGASAETKAHWAAFLAQMNRHFAQEEEVLFPAFEEATGMHGGGPTAVMRLEHRQMRALLQDIGQSVEAGDFQRVLDLGDTLLMIIQQHNAKEEGILYPMADRVLASDWPALKERIAAY